MIDSNLLTAGQRSPPHRFLEQNASSEKKVAATQAALSEQRGHECPQLFVPFVVLPGLSYALDALPFLYPLAGAVVRH